MMHLSRDTRRRLDAAKRLVFPVIFVVSVHQVAQRIEDQASEDDDVFRTLPLPVKGKAQLTICTIFVNICAQKHCFHRI